MRSDFSSNIACKDNKFSSDLIWFPDGDTDEGIMVGNTM